MCLYVQTAQSRANGADFLAHALKDNERRLRGVAGQRLSDAGNSNVKVVGKHGCNDVWVVQVGMDRAMLSFTNFNDVRLSQNPYMWVHGPMAPTVTFAYLFSA